MTDSCVLLETRETASGHLLAVATLNSERSLNALTRDMVDALLPALTAWAADDRVAVVLLRGAGERAFCAGGDVRRLTEHARTGTGDAADAGEFFAREYRLDYFIHRYPKPLLVWGTGVVMGGGMGLFAGAGFRVVTETSRLAMPEIGIGLYPDVGGSYFLPRLPGRLGLFLGLTGCHFGASDARWLGLASHVAAADSWPQLVSRLQACQWSQSVGASTQLDDVLSGLAPSSLPTGPLQQHAEAIAALMAHDDLQTLDHAWRAALPEDPWLAKAVAAYRAGSPTSAALVWQQWHRGREASLAEVFRMEWRLSTQCARHHDFAEGVRALLIDKDQAPRWQPASLAEVSAALLAAHDEQPDFMTAPLDDLETCYGPVGAASA